MLVIRNIFGGIIAALICLLSMASASLAMDKIVALGTGSKNGTYYPVGKAVCDMVNADRMATGVRCIRYSTGGSVYNIEALRSRELDLGITRSFLTFQSANALGVFSGTGKNLDLRAVASLYAMPVAFIVRKDAGISGFDELTKLRFNIGNRGSGKRAVSDLLFKVMGWKHSDFAEVTEFSTKNLGEAFCDGKVDVIIEGLGNPAKLYSRMIEECEGAFIAVPADVVERIRKAAPAMDAIPIPGGLYAGVDEDVPSFGVRATLVSSARVSSETIYNVTKSIFSRLSAFTAMHPALSRLKSRKMAIEGIYIPLHEGAARYYAEIGLR